MRKLHHCAAKLICAAPLVLLTACGGKTTTINVNEYFTTEVQGYNGGGRVSGELDTANLVADHSDAFGLKDSDNVFVFNSIIAEVNNHLTGDFDNHEGLSNGDQVSFVWDRSGIDVLEDTYNIKLEISDVKIDVVDLPSLQEFNPFDYVIINYTKNQNLGRVDTSVTLSDDFPIPSDKLIADYSGDHHIPGGDFTVTIEVLGHQGAFDSETGLTAFEQYCLDYGYQPVEIEKEYQVPKVVN